TVNEPDAPASSSITFTWFTNGTQVASGLGLNSYTPTDADGGKTLTVSVSFNVNAITETGTASAGTVVAVLDASSTVPGQHATEGTSAALTGISITDADATGNVTVTFSVAHGSLTMNTGVTGGLTAGEVTNNGSSSVTVTGSLSQINATLGAVNGLNYLVTTDFLSDTLTVLTRDQGTNPLLPATSTATISITEIDDASSTVPGQHATEG